MFPHDELASFAQLRRIDAGLLDVGYVEIGRANDTPVILLHGWPYDIHAFAEVAPLLAGAGYRVIVPYSRGYGSTRFRSATSFRNGQQSALAQDVRDLMDALKIERAVIGGFDWGSRSAAIMGVLWPERCRALVCAGGYMVVNVAGNKQPRTPADELGWWYQYYFATDRGRVGYDVNRVEFNRLIWHIGSPSWRFDDATYDRTASAFDNLDHVPVVVHSYRWRLGIEAGESQYDDMESRLSRLPSIAVPTVTIGSDSDRSAAGGSGYVKRFTGKHAHRVVSGIGHNVPQEAPREFAQAIIEADRSASA